MMRRALVYWTVVSFIYPARYEMNVMSPMTLDVFGLVVSVYVVLLVMVANLTCSGTG
jgi:hypothetical protein